jgi:hypothetical protein
MARYNTSLASKTITGTTTIVTPDSGSFVQLAGTSGYTVTLPSPAAFPGQNFTFHNTTSGVVTVSTPSGNFVGAGAPGTSSYAIPATAVLSVTSDGTNYTVISEDGSPLTATTGAFSSNVTMDGAGATVNISPQTVTINPGSSGTIDRTSIGSTVRSTAAFTSLTANGATTLTANTPSTTASSGTLVVTGGIGVSGNINSGGTVAAVALNGPLTGTIQTAAQPNITSVGTLTELTVTNTITGSVSGSAATAGTVISAAQPAITSVGTLTSLNVTGNVGVGTTSPSTRMQISTVDGLSSSDAILRLGNTSAFNSLLVGFSGTGDISDDAPAIYATGTPGSTGQAGHIAYKARSGATTRDHIFYTGSTSTERLRINSTGDVTISSTTALKLPSGTTAQRPASPINGMLRYNTSLGSLEGYANGAWNSIGRPLGSQQNPASSPAAILIDNPAAPDGFYYYSSGANVYGAFTRFNWFQSRNWICILKVLNRGDLPSGSALWTNNTLQNENDTNITSGSWAKYGGWNFFEFTRVALDMNGTFPAIMIYNTSRTMFNAMQNNAGAGFGGLGANSTAPSYTSTRYDSAAFYFSGGPFGVQTGNEPQVQLYGINSFANTSTNGNPDNAGLSSTGRAGARIGTPLDEGGHSFGNSTNSGADSGFGFGYCAGNQARTGSAGYAEWSSSAVVNTLPGRIWVS